MLSMEVRFTKFNLRLRLAFIKFLRTTISLSSAFASRLGFPKCSWSSPRTISTSQLHALLHFHLRPIYLILSKGPYLLLMGYLILEGASRLDAFSVYPFRTWLPGYAIGMTTGAPAVRPARSSRTKASSPQISCARAG